jgi:hypothetical protein
MNKRTLEFRSCDKITDREILHLRAELTSLGLSEEAANVIAKLIQNLLTADNPTAEITGEAFRAIEASGLTIIIDGEVKNFAFDIKDGCGLLTLSPLLLVN